MGDSKAVFANDRAELPDNSVVVFGGGAAGMATAIAAAQQGRNVELVEQADSLGGTVCGALIHTLAGLYDDTGEYINQGLPAELARRLLAACPPHA